jgi:uncharacterized Zn finger protein (UPF0148 family)
VSTVFTCDKCGTPVVPKVIGQRENVKLEATQREGVGLCPSCGSGFYLMITRTKEPTVDPEALERRRNRNH